MFAAAKTWPKAPVSKMLEKRMLAAEICPRLVKTFPNKTFMFRELFCMEHGPASMSISFLKCGVGAAWGLEGLQVIVRIYLEFPLLQKKKNRVSSCQRRRGNWT